MNRGVSDDTQQRAAATSLPTSVLVTLLGLVTSVQMLATFSVLALPTLATLAAPHFGFGAESIGYQISVIYCAAALLSSFAGVFVRRHGAAAMSVWALAFSAGGLLGIASGNIAIAILASALIGISYGLTNPAASHLLFRFAPRHRQNIVFALKQTGVPLGGILAALILPRLAQAYNWQIAIATSALLMLLVAVPLLLIRPRLDDDRVPTARIGAGGVLTGIRVVWTNPRLRALAIMGWAYASAQFCLFTFLITMLVKDLGWTLVAAGEAATVMQIGGVLGRLAWSLLADMIGRGVAILVGIGLGSAAFSLIMAAATPDWSAWLLVMMVFGFGFCLVGWNGLWLAEVARAAGPGEVSLATGGVLAFTFVGVVLGPATFATVYRVTESYAHTYGIFSIPSLLGAAVLIWSMRTSPSPKPG
ncbi:MAG: MFS transporter [Hyphomicrobiaceae bacterium]